MIVQITDDKLHGICIASHKKFEIQHESKGGKDLTSLAKIASKSPWFEKDNPQFKPNTFHSAELLDNGRIKLIY